MRVADSLLREKKTTTENDLRLFELGPGPYCDGCLARDECGAANTEFACTGEWPDPRWGGEHVLHPLHPEAKSHIEKLHGYRLSQFRAQVRPVPILPAYLPQIPFRTALKGYLNQDWYGLRAKGVFRRGGIKSADEIRMRLGLSEVQKIAVLLFDKDPLLERIYNDPRLVKELALAGYDLITAASFSIWEPRPRLHQLHNLIRSLELFVALQQEGANAVPRLDWVIPHDVRRSVDWLIENPSIEMISIDAMTSRSSGWPQIASRPRRIRFGHQPTPSLSHQRPVHRQEME